MFRMHSSKSSLLFNAAYPHGVPRERKSEVCFYSYSFSFAVDTVVCGNS